MFLVAIKSIQWVLPENSLYITVLIEKSHKNCISQFLSWVLSSKCRYLRTGVLYLLGFCILWQFMILASYRIYNQSCPAILSLERRTRRTWMIIIHLISVCHWFQHFSQSELFIRIRETICFTLLSMSLTDSDISEIKFSKSKIHARLTDWFINSSLTERLAICL